MKRSQLINQIIVKCGLAETIPEANRMFVQNFVDYYLDWNLEKWDTEVPTDVAERFSRSVSYSRGMSVRYLIKDLDAMLKK